VGYLQTALRELCDVQKSDFQVLSNVLRIAFQKGFDDFLNNQRLSLSFFISNRLLLSIEMDRAGHQNQRGVEHLFVDRALKIPPGVQDNFIIDALLLALMVDAHISENSQTELLYLLLVLGRHDFLNELLADDGV
jgi:hypothetical protein